MEPYVLTPLFKNSLDISSLLKIIYFHAKIFYSYCQYLSEIEWVYAPDLQFLKTYNTILKIFLLNKTTKPIEKNVSKNNLNC